MNISRAINILSDYRSYRDGDTDDFNAGLQTLSLAIDTVVENYHESIQEKKDNSQEMLKLFREVRKNELTAKEALSKYKKMHYD